MKNKKDNSSTQVRIELVSPCWIAMMFCGNEVWWWYVVNMMILFYMMIWWWCFAYMSTYDEVYMMMLVNTWMMMRMTSCGRLYLLLRIMHSWDNFGPFDDLGCWSSDLVSIPLCGFGMSMIFSGSKWESILWLGSLEGDGPVSIKWIGTTCMSLCPCTTSYVALHGS